MPTATHASGMNPVETHAKGLDELAIPGTGFASVAELADALDRAAEYWNVERKVRGKRFRDTVRADRRHASKEPLRPRTTKPDES